MSILQKRSTKYIGALAFGLAGLLATSVAVANSWGGDRYGDHGRGYKQNEPRFIDEGDSLRAKVEVRDLDRKRDLKVRLKGEARVDIECQSRSRGAWGKQRSISKRILIDLEDIEYYSRHEIRGDKLYIDIETEKARRALDYDWGVYGCAGRDWDRRIRNVQFESATFVVTQGGRTVVRWECEFLRPTRTGEVPLRDVECRRHY